MTSCSPAHMCNWPHGIASLCSALGAGMSSNQPIIIFMGWPIPFHGSYLASKLLPYETSAAEDYLGRLFWWDLALPMKCLWAPALSLPMAIVILTRVISFHSAPLALPSLCRSPNELSSKVIPSSASAKILIHFLDYLLQTILAALSMSFSQSNFSPFRNLCSHRTQTLRFESKFCFCLPFSIFWKTSPLFMKNSRFLFWKTHEQASCFLTTKAQKYVLFNESKNP